MGRPFLNELKNIDDTFSFFYNYSTEAIYKVLDCFNKYPALAIGSGGAFSVAKAFEIFNQRCCQQSITKAITPVELLNYESLLYDSTIVLFTAGGNNPDTVNTFRFLSTNPSKCFLTLCTNDRAKIRKIEPYTNIWGTSLPGGKDGFLAVNSIVAMIIALGKAFYKYSNSNFYQLNRDLCYNQAVKGLANLEWQKVKTIFVLHAGIATPAAYDMESKFSEAGIVNVQLVDYRNFAHGRHHWLSVHEDTAVIALYGPNENLIAKKTLNILPAKIQRICIETCENNINGVLELFYQVFEFTYRAGVARSLDPGRPHVAEYGKKLYHISYNPYTTKKKKNIQLEIAVARKVNKKSALHDSYHNALSRFIENITSTCFESVVFDYDGTLTKGKKLHDDIIPYLQKFLDNGIKLGFATGRGKSIHSDLRNALPKKSCWEKIVIGYYNGGDIDYLSSNPPNIAIEANPSLALLQKELSLLLGSYLKTELRPKQLTCLLDINNLELTEIIMIACSKYSDIKAYCSGHSIDIVPLSSSKCNVFQYMGSENSTLALGDSGQLGGNDFELLSSKYSLSVKNVSKSMNTCWNIAPHGMEYVDATIYYLESIVFLNNGTFKLSI